MFGYWFIRGDPGDGRKLPRLDGQKVNTKGERNKDTIDLLFVWVGLALRLEGIGDVTRAIERFLKNSCFYCVFFNIWIPWAKFLLTENLHVAKTHVNFVEESCQSVAEQKIFKFPWNRCLGSYIVTEISCLSTLSFVFSLSRGSEPFYPNSFVSLLPRRTFTCGGSSSSSPHFGSSLLKSSSLSNITSSHVKRAKFFLFALLSTKGRRFPEESPP